MFNYRGMGLREAVLAAAVLLALPVGVDAQTPAAPSNDNYLQSAALNAPGSRLERRDTLRATVDTTNATVQTDVFNPPQNGGPAEPTVCEGTSYGKTVWYDFYPDVNGVVQLRASGYDTVLTVVPFDRSTGNPNFAAAQCANVSNSTTEAFFVEVRRRDAYTVQVGGVGTGGGPLEFLFDFLADTDGDGVLDEVDRCDRLVGARGNNGCPRSQRFNAKLRAVGTATGIEVVGLTVTTGRGSRVVVSCSSGCRRQVKRARSTVRFPALRGVALRAGVRLDVRVTRPGFFGDVKRFTILRGNLKSIERCTYPGSRRLRKKCP
jgi:hypothetical protein